MTSRNLFFKIVKQDLRKRIWCPIIMFIAFFLSMELNLLKTMDSIKFDMVEYDIKYFVTNMLFTPAGNLITTFLVIVMAILCGISGFAYLHSRKQLDTYHSLPVSRTTLFLGKYVSGILMFLIPFVLHTFVSFAIGCSKGFVSHAVTNMFGFILSELVFYMLVYTVCIFAVLITGNIIISILGSGVLLVYSVCFNMLKEGLFSTFFYTYSCVTYSYVEKAGSDTGLSFSPLEMIYDVIHKINENTLRICDFSYSNVLPDIMVILAIVIAMTAVDIVIYRIRPTEAAGKAMAFRVAEPIIKTLIVIPTALFTGLIFAELVNYQNSFGWYIFGTVFSFFIISFALEIVFRFDMKSFLAHKMQLLFNGVCLALIVVIFKGDVLGYNTYIPSDKEITGCAVSINDLLEISVQEDSDIGWGYNYINGKDYRMQNMNITDNPSIMALARKSVQDQINPNAGTFPASEYYYDICGNDDSKYRSIEFGYHLKNGKTVYRQYYIDLNDKESVKLLGDIFNDTEYKTASMPLFSSDNKKYVAIDCENNYTQDTLKLPADKMQELIDTYKSEYMGLTLDDVMTKLPVGNITFTTYGSYAYYDAYKIYPQFKKTIELIKECGFDYESSEYQRNIENVRIYDYGIDYDYDYEDMPNVEYSDDNEISELMSTLVRSDLVQGVYGYTPIEYNDYNIEVSYWENGSVNTDYYEFVKGRIPQFVQKDVEAIAVNEQK